MSNFKANISSKIQENRPKLSISSLRTYVSILSNISKKISPENDSVDWFSDKWQLIMDYLEDKTIQTRKTSLSALYVLTEKNEYREVMLNLLKEFNETYKEQKKNVKQTENWISITEIKDVYSKLLDNATKMLTGRKIMNEHLMMSFWLVALLGGVSGISPRRSMDYGLMKIRNYNIEEDNYYKNGFMYFNSYKTSKKYGLQSIELPKEINFLLKKWIQLNENDFLLYSSNGNKLSSPQINRILNEVFGKKISVDMLRTIYLTDLYKDVPAISQMQEIATSMGHSINQAMEYVKKNEYVVI
jgi:hypothetical protein